MDRGAWQTSHKELDTTEVSCQQQQGGPILLQNVRIIREMFQTTGTKETSQLNTIYDPRLDPGPNGKHAIKDIIRSNDKTETFKFD